MHIRDRDGRLLRRRMGFITALALSGLAFNKDEGEGGKKDDGGGGGGGAKPPVVLPAPAAKEERNASPPPPPAKDDVLELADDDERDLPEGDKPVKITKKNLDRRLATAKKSERRAILAELGIEDVEEVKKRLKRAADADKAEEDAKKAAMTEQQRLEKERDDAVRERDDLKTRNERAVQEREIERTDHRVSKIALKYVDEDAEDVAISLYAKHVRREFDLSTKEGRKKADAIDDDYVASFFKGLVEKKPKYGREVAGGDGGGSKKDKEKKPKVHIHTGGTGNQPPEKQPEKTMRPNQKNSMTTEEARKGATVFGKRIRVPF